MGPTNKAKGQSFPLYKKVRSFEILHGAWLKVRENGLKSDSAETKKEIEEFSRRSNRNLRRICDQLFHDKFVFAPARGVLLKKKQSKRPVVIAPVPSRIVQRAVLDVVQAIPQIRVALQAGYNFGGVEGSKFGVPPAIKKALIASQSKGYYIRTDIKSFFVDVPRETALKKITQYTGDSKLDALLKRATDTELDDAAKYGREILLFPLEAEGVAQGSCLSPLLCNLLLQDFDEQMNSKGVDCIRYIDDFILFAPNKSKALKAFKSALLHLSSLGLKAYDPLNTNERDKAEHGPTTGEFTFLGCDVRRDRVRPSEKNRSTLIKNVKAVFDEAILAMANPSIAIRSKKAYANAIVTAANKIRGWGNTFSYCNDEQLMRNVDLQLDQLFSDFNKRVRRLRLKMAPLDASRALGFWSLQDCNRESVDEGVRKVVGEYQMKSL